MRGQQVARLYTLVMDLARSRQGIPAATLAQRHGWKLRTVYRDLDALQAAGFPVAQGEGAKWKFVDGWHEELPFPVSPGELLSLYVANDLMRPLRGTPPALDFANLMSKLAQPRARRASGQGELFPASMSPLSTPSALGIDYEPHAAVVESLWSAIAEQKVIECEYYTASRDEETRRRLNPYAMHYEPTLEALYVFAWCHLRKEVRTFAVHRFRSVIETDERFEGTSGFDVEHHLAGAFRVWRSENVRKIVLRLESSAQWVTERRWHASQKVEEEEQGTFRLEFEVGDEVELRRFILGLGDEVEVIEPATLRKDIAEIHRAAYERGARKEAGGKRMGERDSLSSDDTQSGDDSAHG